MRHSNRFRDGETTSTSICVYHGYGCTAAFYGWDAHFNARKNYCANLGHQEDETGLVYMRARYYEPTTGRFITEDPARDGMNWYLYADGNAVRNFDPDGTMSAAEKALIGNIYVLIGLFAMGVGLFELTENAHIQKLLWDKEVDKAVKTLSQKYGKNAVEQALSKVRLEIVREGIKAWGRMRTTWVGAFLAIGGYALCLHGQLLRTEADQEEPGCYDWEPW